MPPCHLNLKFKPNLKKGGAPRKENLYLLTPEMNNSSIKSTILAPKFYMSRYPISKGIMGSHQVGCPSVFRKVLCSAKKSVTSLTRTIW